MFLLVVASIVLHAQSLVFNEEDRFVVREVFVCISSATPSILGLRSRFDRAFRGRRAFLLC